MNYLQKQGKTLMLLVVNWSDSITSLFSYFILIAVQHVGNGLFYCSIEQLKFYTYLEHFAAFPTNWKNNKAE